MRETPMLYQGAMVRAILRDVVPKSQTRRLAKFITEPGLNLNFTGLSATRFGESWCLVSRGAGGAWEERSKPLRSPYGLEGDRLWVRESWTTHKCFDAVKPADLTTRSFHYAADGACDTGKGRPSIHMPRFVSRILLEITEVRVQRLQDISEEDAIAEGIDERVFGDDPCRWRVYGLFDVYTSCPIRSYESLWDSINGSKPGAAWADNPWVWAVSFTRVTP